MSDQIITIEKLTEEEWKLAEKMKELADKINWAPVASLMTGLVFILIVCFTALYFAKSGAANIRVAPEAIFGYLAEQLVGVLFLFAAVAVVSFVSYFAYFRRQARKRLEELNGLSRDPRFLPVLRKLCQLERDADEIKRMQNVLGAFDSKDILNSKPLREFLGSLPPI